MCSLGKFLGVRSTERACFDVRNFSSPLLYTQIRTATKKASTYKARKTRNRPNYLGIKREEGTLVQPANVILTQRGFSHHLGFNVHADKRHSIYASRPGRVRFHYNPLNDRKYVSVDDGNLPPLYTLPHVKYIVGEKINVEKYLNSTTDEKMKYVREKFEEFIDEYREEMVTFFNNRAMHKRTRKCNLIDISLL